jgi:hypothetical protein
LILSFQNEEYAGFSPGTEYFNENDGVESIPKK